MLLGPEFYHLKWELNLPWRMKEMVSRADSQKVGVKSVVLRNHREHFIPGQWQLLESCNSIHPLPCSWKSHLLLPL